MGCAWSSLPGFGTPDHAQPIGVLFPVSLSNGITITRDASAGAGTTEDDYSFQVLQSRQYSLAVTGDSLAPSYYLIGTALLSLFALMAIQARGQRTAQTLVPAT